jgi:hypothetical protein
MRAISYDYYPIVPLEAFADHRKGIDNNIREAYAFLCQNWRRQEQDDGTPLDDEIVLIGFSRGAFTVRALAHLIDTIGLATKDSVEYINDWFDAWKGLGSSAESLDAMRQRTEYNERLRPRVSIKACAIWDTVSALTVNKLAFVEKEAPKNVRLVFHALALDEERSQFQPLLWQDPDDGTVAVQQCWFLGTHSDVGGGHEESGLSNLSLAWMLARLRESDVLDFDDDAIRDLNLKTLSTEINKQLIQRYKVGQAKNYGHYSLNLVIPDKIFRARTQRHVGNVDMVLRLGGWSYREPDERLHSLHWTAIELLRRGWADCKPLQKKHNNEELWRLMLEEYKSAEEEDILKAWIGSDCLRLIQTCEELETLRGNEGGEPILVSAGDVNPLFAVLWSPGDWETKNVSRNDIGVQVSVNGDIQIGTTLSGDNTDTESGGSISPIIKAPVFADYGPKWMTFSDNPEDGFASLFSWTTNYQVKSLTGNITIPFHRSLIYSSKSSTTPGQLPVPDETMQKERGSTRKPHIFNEKTPVQMAVKDRHLRVVPKALTVTRASLKAGRWVYQLEEDDGTLYNGGTWIDEGYLNTPHGLR